MGTRSSQRGHHAFFPHRHGIGHPSGAAPEPGVRAASSGSAGEHVSMTDLVWEFLMVNGAPHSPSSINHLPLETPTPTEITENKKKALQRLTPLRHRCIPFNLYRI